MTVEWVKAFRLAIVVAGLVVMAALGTVDGEIAAAAVLILVGYVTGNGKNAAKGVESPPVIRPNHEDG